jgi:hypothetical protein
MRYESLNPTAGLGTQGAEAGKVLAGERDLPGGAARALVDVFWASTAKGARKATKKKKKQTANQLSCAAQRLRERVISTTPCTKV